MKRLFYFGLSLATPAWAVTEPPAALGNWLLNCTLVIALILLLAWLLKKSRLVPPLGHSGMKIVSSLPLGYKEKLLVVQIGEQQWLLGVTPQQITRLGRVEPPLDVAPSPAFAQQLGKLLGGGIGKQS